MFNPVSLSITTEDHTFSPEKENIDELFNIDLSKFFNCATTQGIQSQPATSISAMPPKTNFTMSESIHAAKMALSELDTSKQTAKADNTNNFKAPLKKPPVSKAVVSPPNEPIHSFFEAYKLSSLLNPTKDLEDLLMTLSIDQIKFIEGLLSRIKKRKNYHLKKGNPSEASSLSTAFQGSVAEPEISLNISLPSNKLASESNALGELLTPSLSAFNTSPSCFQTLSARILDHSTDNILVKENGEIWMKFKAKNSNISQELRVDIDPCHSEQELMSTEFAEANSLFPEATTQSEKDLNSLGLRLAFLNPHVLTNNRPLLCEVIATFQVHFPGMLSSQSKDCTSKSILSSSNQPLSTSKMTDLSNAMIINVYTNGVSTSLFIHTDLDSVDLDNIDEEFKNKNCVFPRAFQQSSRRSIEDNPSFEIETALNQWGWKLAFLNPADLAGNIPQLQCALDTYRNTFTPFPARPSTMMPLPTTMPPGSTIELSGLLDDHQLLSIMDH